MKFLFFKLILREFKSQKLRMALTIAGITWGTIAITLLMAFSMGIEKQMMKASRGLGKGIVILWPGQTSMVYEGLPQGRRIHFAPEDMQLIKDRIPEIDKISGEYLRWGVNVEYGHVHTTKLVSGVYPEFRDLRSHYPQMGGRFLNNLDIEQKRRVVFLGDKVAKEIFGSMDPIGKLVTLNNVPFEVIGVMTKKLQNSMYHGPDDDCLVIPASSFVMIFGDPWYDDFVYSVKPGVDTRDVEKTLLRLFGSKYRFNPEDERALWFWDIKRDAEIQEKVFLGITIFMWFIGGMTLVIAGVGVANIMYVAVRERTKEIGTKIALGAEKRHITIQFMTEALTIAFTGGFLGLAISALIAKLFGLIPMEGALEFLGRPDINWPVALITVATLSLIGFLAGYFPARKAASINPVEALRYE
jgi:putative ABC transport system permease protein